MFLFRMGEAAGVPIEPKEQSQLLDFTIELPGVVAAAVPGGWLISFLVCEFELTMCG